MGTASSGSVEVVPVAAIVPVFTSIVHIPALYEGDRYYTLPNKPLVKLAFVSIDLHVAWAE